MRTFVFNYVLKVSLSLNEVHSMPLSYLDRLAISPTVTELKSFNVVSFFNLKKKKSVLSAREDNSRESY